jgi:hypothetical protein
MLTDGYMCKVPAKCSYRQLMVIEILRTSCMFVTEFYSGLAAREFLRQIYRRLTDVRELNEIK